MNSEEKLGTRNKFQNVIALDTLQDNDNPYVQLANTLNTIPNGFAIIEDGTHLKVLKWIFTPEEAELTSKLKLSGETIDEISIRLGISTNNLRERLETMESKGQIRSFISNGIQKYGLFPFVIGIYEEQVENMNEEFAELIDDYFSKSRGAELLSSTPEIHKVIPVNVVIKPELNIYPYESAEKMIEGASSWGVRDCICRKQKELVGERCNYTKNVCLTFSKTPNAFDESSIGRSINKEEAIELLRQAEEEGLIHSTMNIQQGQNYICNCCTCCCGIMRGLTEWDRPTAFVKSNYQISVDHENCILCGNCVDRCQFGAIEVNGEIEIDLGKCVGCGVCAVTCDDNALMLVQRESGQISEPSQDMQTWMMNRAMSRGIDPSKLL